MRRAALAFVVMLPHAAAADEVSVPQSVEPPKAAAAVPPWPQTIAIEERGDSPSYYRSPRSISTLALRPSVKGLAQIAGESDDGFGVGADIHLAGRFGLGRGRSLGLWPELGYVYSSGGHFASAGLGVASQTPPLETSFASGLSFGIVPHVLVGTKDGDGALGLRTSAIAEIYFDDGNAWGLELAHQMTAVTGQTIHELVFGISLTWGVRRWR